MSLLARRREFLQAFRKTGSLEAAAAQLHLEPSIHTEWMKDWLYRGAFAEVQKEMKLEAEGKLPPPAPPKRIGRPPKPKLENPPPKRPRGRPPRNPPPPTIPEGSPDEPVPVSAPPDVPLPPVQEPEALPPTSVPLEEGVIEPSVRGYTRLYVPQEELPAVQEPEKPKPPKEEPPEAPLEITVTSDEQQRALIDEYGELDRRMQLRATDTARYESLKRAIKSWFCNVPADADGTVEGDVYLLHLSACERERKIRSLRELVEVIGLDKILDLAVVPIGQLENILGKDHVATLTMETRSGSRRIKAIPKRPAAVQ